MSRKDERHPKREGVLTKPLAMTGYGVALSRKSERLRKREGVPTKAGR